MKKKMAILLALALVFALSTAAADAYLVAGYYTIEYPDTLQLDSETYSLDNTEDDIWVYLLENDDYIIDAYLTATGIYEDFSLTGADESGIAEYLEEAMTSFDEQNPSLADVFTANSGTVFYIYSMSDSTGPYLFAETIEDGISINFICYYFDATAEADAALLEALETVLVTYVPVTEE